jgi:branched-subunit amino acid transport protein
VRASLLITFAAMGVATYLTRAPFLVLFARRRLPGWLGRYFAALPIALLVALAVPLVLLDGGRFVSAADPRLPAALAVILVARRTGNLLLAVATGAVLVAALRALLG